MLMRIGSKEVSSADETWIDVKNPATGEFSLTNSLNDARTGHFATLLKNGHVLIAGGNGLATSYGVYQFVEDYLGVRFLTPDLTYVPNAPPAPSIVRMVVLPEETRR